MEEILGRPMRRLGLPPWGPGTLSTCSPQHMFSFKLSQLFPYQFILLKLVMSTHQRALWYLWKQLPLWSGTVQKEHIYVVSFFVEAQILQVFQGCFSFPDPTTASNLCCLMSPESLTRGSCEGHGVLELFPPPLHPQSHLLFAPLPSNLLFPEEISCTLICWQNSESYRF